MTQFQIQKTEFTKLLARATSVAEAKGTMPILGNVRLSFASGQGLTLQASDLGVYLSVTSQEVILKKGIHGDVTTNAKELARFVKSLPEGAVSFEYNPEDYTVTLSSGKSKLKLPGTAASDFPKFPEVPALRKVEPSILVDVISKTLYATSEDETRAHLNGVYFERTSEGVTAASTDGHRLACVKREGLLLNHGIIVPRKACEEISKLFSEKGEEPCAVESDRSRIYVSKGSVTLIAQLIDAQFPDYQQVIPDERKTRTTATVNRLELKDALNRLAQIGSVNAGVTLSLGKGALKLSTNDARGKEGIDEIACTVGGPSLEIGCSAVYLGHILSATQSLEVELRFEDAISPITVVPCDDKDYICVVMPMRI